MLQLLRAWPGACAQHDPDGCLPLHFAVQSFASRSVLRALLNAHPAAIKAACGYDDLLPLHVALEHQATAIPRPRPRRPPDLPPPTRLQAAPRHACAHPGA